MSNLHTDDQLIFDSSGNCRIYQQQDDDNDLSVEANNRLILKMSRDGNGQQTRTIRFIDDDVVLAEFNYLHHLVVNYDIQLQGQYSAIRCQGEGATIRFEQDSPTVWCDGGLRFFLGATHEPNNTKFEIVVDSDEDPVTVVRIDPDADEIYLGPDISAVNCHAGIRVVLNADGQTTSALTSFIVATSVGSTNPPMDLLIVDPSSHKIEMANKLWFTSPDAEDRQITTSVGALNIGANTDVVLVANDKGIGSGDIVFRYSEDDIATFSSSQAFFRRKVDASTEGVRTKPNAGVPGFAGDDGDLVVDTDNQRFYVRVGGNWKYAALV